MRFPVSFSLFVSIFIFTIHCQKQLVPQEEISRSVPNPKIYIQREGTAKRGSFVGMEPYLNQYSYATEDSFYLALHQYFQMAKENELLYVDRSIIVLPEYIGTWLVVTAEDQSIFATKTIQEAMEVLVKQNFGSFLWHYLFSSSYSSDTLKETLFRMKAWQMSDRYQSVFARLAREYRVSIVAGSIVLPHPRVIEGKITPTDGPLENVSFYFHPDGRVDDKIVRKLFPITDEKEFLKEGKLDENPSYLTPLGKLYTMICADSWFPDVYKEFKKTESELLAIPSFVSPADAWTHKWQGYNGYANPKDVDPKDIGLISERSAWKKYAMNGRLKDPKVKAGINVFFRGEIWDLAASGDAFLSLSGKSVFNLVKEEKNQGRIYVLYL
ncbi:carbon-nitrogen hydrolase family protein [Leptospira sp. 2 VSF19]|uniref:Carbon-nitrogen hydrolase family protein n=1 Tax=Leptospira soteropolitanensis TaxID=2950025 RepID=A0AAW5V9T4_9LEPT|nr:nitrilase-related carbon-nitrogen hydrolase [Leptospira soteropolitanensis]MCW7491635.1 carbon-nitrogen hydrolase family protein [Leptospira soteropolitanensis]MCW7499219.1 carbon-nitrogen hydrolase family protein [Leptospira soteropolitanensis]MCW7521189.1 carbon-nitrogen hydrolase family protein [Leptospira soteropolitanensis]MCW7525323.1 carbon-nitrogen hydrolase family protein [Leptospira soteropolitanensis]MCW7529190.1 carbon-nitrogen hydrolase family protein [Leptospira soteropolitane